MTRIFELKSSSEEEIVTRLSQRVYYELDKQLQKNSLPEESQFAQNEPTALTPAPELNQSQPYVKLPGNPQESKTQHLQKSNWASLLPFIIMVFCFFMVATAIHYFFDK